VLTDWSWDWALGPLLAVVVGAYVTAVFRLRRRGDAWSPLRTASFLGGAAVLAVATLSGLAAYDHALFWAHMVQHMLLAMVAPILLALGAPITLALRVSGGLPKRALLGVLHSRVARVLTFPLVGWLIFVGTPFVVYTTGLYEETLRTESLHLLLHTHFVVAGCLFFWPLIGLDPVPGRVAHGFRLLMVLASLPFHAFLGVTLMSRETVIAGGYYAELARSWGPTPLHDQEIGGGLLWATGDLVGLLLLVALLAQWMRADERVALREDRRLDRLDAVAAASGSAEDAALAQWNARLAALDQRDRRSRPSP
jgi:putative copper resistance protein D